MYQLNKNKLSEPSAEALRETLENTSLDGYGTIETYPKGTIIFKEGEEASCMYILHVGAVGIYSHYGESNQVKLTELTDASFFGEMGMLAEEPRSATAVSEDDTTYVEIIYPEDLEALFKNCPVKIDMLLRHLSHRLRQLNNDFLRTCKEITETYDKK